MKDLMNLKQYQLASYSFMGIPLDSLFHFLSAFFLYIIFRKLIKTNRTASILLSFSFVAIKEIFDFYSVYVSLGFFDSWMDLISAIAGTLFADTLVFEISKWNQAKKDSQHRVIEEFMVLRKDSRKYGSRPAYAILKKKWETSAESSID